ncbi:type III polyketide synthase [Paenibacillus sp. UNC499MF]|uniref:type III polyketide synthase n=1 Tax=Paenibacillus sp. UNC499MF TaxID=1502751 RepID=UPI00089FA797|nr:type III polyketide synthase [Paenibacillus sp. UNC499MF]SEF67469.1 Predicted naringenin-chalcone synthase [Paenibacillus sp. UNC499MF]
MNQNKTTPATAILGIGTAVPAHRLEQSEVVLRLAQALERYPDSARWAKRLFKQCGVQTRYTCEPGLLEPVSSCRYLPDTEPGLIPTTAERMAVYKKESLPLAHQAAGQALADSGLRVSDITHLITVSCTGQFLPGLDAVLVRELGLSPEVSRIPLQFIGCAAGLRAVCLAREIADSAPQANVLIVSVELCTLHIQPSGSKEALFGASFFGDGASACVIGRTGQSRHGIFGLGEHRSVLIPEAAEEMTWEVGNFGFDLYLSPHIPKLITNRIPPEVGKLLGGERLPELWAIHPGGKGIVDAVQQVYGLTEEQTAPSRQVLRDFGNLSSATIFFVLQQMRTELRTAGADTADGIALAFGPGITAELIRFTYMPVGAAEEKTAHAAV